MSKKKCRTCKKIKPLDEFHRQGIAKDGRRVHCAKCIAKAQHAVRLTSAGRIAQQHRHLKRDFDITYDDYWNMMKEQNGVCAICGEPETRRYRGVLSFLCVDHNHATGKIRGLLCTTCNTGVGLLKEDVTLLKKAMEYLKKYEEE